MSAADGPFLALHWVTYSEARDLFPNDDNNDPPGPAGDHASGSHSSVALKSREDLNLPPEIEELSAAGARMGKAMESILRAMPVSRAGAAELARFLKVDANVPRRIFAALRNHNSLAILQMSPGFRALDKFFNAASSHVSGDLIRSARQAARDAERMIRSNIGGRKNLALLVAMTSPDARRDIETNAKRTAFQGMSQWLGCQARCALGVYIVHPSFTSSERCNLAIVQGLRGFRCHGSSVQVPLHIGCSFDEPESQAPPMLTLDGENVRNDTVRTMITDYCSRPIPSFRRIVEGDRAYFLLDQPDFDLTRETDVYFGYNCPDALQSRAGARRNHEMLNRVTTVPVSAGVLDVYLHDDVWPGASPEFAVFRIVPLGPIEVFDERKIDRINTLDRVEFMGRGIAAGPREIPQYVEMLRDSFARLKLNESKFRLFRCSVDFPPVFTQMTMRFMLPPRNDGSAG